MEIDFHNYFTIKECICYVSYPNSYRASPSSGLGTRVAAFSMTCV